MAARSDVATGIVVSPSRSGPVFRARYLIPALYIIGVLLPIYWLLNMSFKTTNEILGSFTLWPQNFTLENYDPHPHIKAQVSV